ncbi:transglycosylase domain-containing protein [Alkalibacillus haloalkaliphilus]|uniref:transglycosylase domain-containing protein n=1 Tax=Alkalibacillus haloalkaliphilus TaxID=94136 RepID=UPI0029357DE4|nr:PBP1A family penicillin-binding protein [Alkalibacillus haloalkaliphilus]MDV2583443.1 PBP1A family penicillin-binding protein [Alkalibacillus haloalkaliphilus]
MAVKTYMRNTFGKWRWVLYSVGLLIVLSLLGFMFILLGGRFVVDDQHFVFSESTVLETEDGDEVVKLYDENRTYVPLETVPEQVVDAFLAIEDHRFYDHSGVDFWAVGRALYRDVTTWSKAEGASTITQQLVKNTALTNDQTWMRKTKEVMGAIYFERQRSKDEILEYYLNEIYFGNGIYGVEEAAQTFFSKSVSELTISEGALLAAMPRAPNYYSPLNNEERAMERRDLVIERMYQIGMLDAETARHEQGKTLGLNIGETKESPWLSSYIDLVLDELEEDYHFTREEIYTGGYRVTVGLDPKVQEVAYQRMQQDEFFQGSQEGVEGSTVILDQDTGVVRAAIGGREHNRGDLNRVNVKRQPGSTFKPLAVYGPALEESLYHPYTLLTDEPIDYGNYSPRNVDETYDGEVTMYDALKDSKNVPAVALLEEIGVQQGLSYLRDLGFDIEDQGLSVALGGLEEGVSPLHMAALYRTFAQGGEYIEPYTILQVENRHGEQLDSPEPEVGRLFSEQTSWYLTRMLEGVVTDGTAAGGEFPKDFAGKTGSTQHPHHDGGVRDAWFIGFNPNYTVASWIGYDVSDEEHYLTAGSRMATALVDTIMTDLDGERSLQTSFTVPDHLDDLEPPVRLPEITDLSANVSLGFLDGLYVDISWSGETDERINYNVYREIDGEVEQIGTVAGETRYRVRQVQMINNPSYFVIPVNPLNGEEGEQSNRDSAF